MREIHLAGGYGIQEIVQYNRDQIRTAWNYPQFFPFWEIAPGAAVYVFGERSPASDATLMVINLNARVWETVREALPGYGRRILLQMEGYTAWEAAYENARCFDRLINFDPNYSSHPGFKLIHIPYIPSMASSHRDKRGLEALTIQWRYSRRAFMDVYGLRFAPRKKKAILIATLQRKHGQYLDHYLNRLEMVRKWGEYIDVFGAGWPNDIPNYRGLCVSKADVMRRYRFALIMENQRQPGYISEKLLDCYLTRTVPLYWGAPDADRLVPLDTIIPIDESSRLDELIQDNRRYEQTYAALQRQADDVLASFGVEPFVRVLREVFIEEEALKEG
ncbi:MAG TPA: glycosyltransferase family 10 [Anaerolineaceae bacterium]|nr:glycosyltransferase family 10 [Anaerolineaceae bacterium]